MTDIRTLLVDDDENFRNVLVRRLTKRGIFPEQAETGEACLSILEKTPVDVVILDVKMPGMDGIEVLRHIKADYPGTEVILLTGHESVEDGVEGIRSGAFDYLTKPLDLERLVCKIEQAYSRIQIAEENRREAESRYQTLLQSVTDYVIAINRNHQIIMCNNLFMNEFGNNQRCYCYRAWKGRDETCRDCLVEKAFGDGRSHASEETVVRKDGQRAQMLVKSTPVLNEKGKIAYVLVTATDVTLRRRMQEELSKVSGKLEDMIGKRLRKLEESEEKYRTIFERSWDAMILTDHKGDILEINPAGLELLGYRGKDELCSAGSAMGLFENRDDLSRFQRQLFSDGFVTEFETRISAKNGGPFDAVITSSVVLDIIGQITGYVMLVRDVTIKKSAQQEIENRNFRLAVLNAISMTVNSSLDLDNVLNRTIDKMVEILGTDCVRIYLLDDNREILNLAAHQGFSPNFINKSFMRSRRVGDGLLGKTVLTRETRIVDNCLRADEPYVDAIVEEGVQSTVYVPLLLKGEAVGVMCTCSHEPFTFSEDYVDFLTAIGNQIGMALHNAMLYESANRTYRELKDVQEQVIRSEKLASLGRLSATIAHEINNPIAAVLTYVKLMMKLVDRGRFCQDRIEDILRYLQTMSSEMTRCGDIVKNLLAFSRQTRIEIKVQDIEPIIRRTLDLLSHNLTLKDIRLIVTIPPDLPQIRCDFRQIQQALLNLIINASEAMDNGGTLTISAAPAEKDGFLEITVSDTGGGISDEDQKSIFEPFFTTKEEGKGVGLGLSVVYGIISNHNGSIEVESEVGKGSTFRVLLPVC
ncbi:MAG: Histidine kinase [Thermodesulfobacteriota bacterium]|nr:Histidine kinase [Thermodesulfobacteriota bacterium]